MARVSTKIKLKIIDGEATVSRRVQVGKKIFAEFDLAGTRYVLDRSNTRSLLGRLESFGADCSDNCKRVRASLRIALAK